MLNWLVTQLVHERDRDLLRAMMAESRAVPIAERRRFILGSVLGAARIAVRSLLVDTHIWLAALMAGAAMPLVDAHEDGSCVLFPLLISVCALFALVSRWAAWRWPVAVLVGLALSAHIWGARGFIDGPDALPLAFMALGATLLTAGLRRLVVSRVSCTFILHI